MTLVPLTECCLRLGIDPKTLRLWLKMANLSCCLHPIDARLKCLTLPQLQHVADEHGRPLLSAAPAGGGLSAAVSVNPACTVQEHSITTPAAHEMDLPHQLHLLQAQVTALQVQVTDLALALLHARSQFPSLPPPPPPASVLPSSSPFPSTPSLAPGTTVPSPRSTPPQAERGRTRSHALPLIQVRADSSVVIIAPTEGVLPLIPDSPEWFAWLSSLTAFTFEGQQGHFSATRKGQRVQAWNVHRSLHGRSCTIYLGLTLTLTLARLQEMTRIVHTRLTTV